MNLPFTTEEFLKVFEVYNLSVWPMQVVLYLLAVTAVYLSVRERPYSGLVISMILAFFWIWMGIVYHILNFSLINPAAYLFGAFFLLQGALFLYFGVYRHRLSFRFHADIFGLAGAVLILYALVIYPILGYALGHVYPQAPTFGLPCPTTIFTLGLLLWTSKKFSLFLPAIPWAWSLIGFSAAFTLGIWEDTGLLVAGVLSAVLLVIRARGSSGSADNN